MAKKIAKLATFKAGPGPSIRKAKMPPVSTKQIQSFEQGGKVGDGRSYGKADQYVRGDDTFERSQTIFNARRANTDSYIKQFDKTRDSAGKPEFEKNHDDLKSKGRAMDMLQDAHFDNARKR